MHPRVTALEAARLEEEREEREAFLSSLREELARQAAAKGVALRLPPAPPKEQQQHQQQLTPPG